MHWFLERFRTSLQCWVVIVFVLISKVESNHHHGHSISANLGVVGRHNAIGLLLEVVLGALYWFSFSWDPFSWRHLKCEVKFASIWSFKSSWWLHWRQYVQNKVWPSVFLLFLWLGSSGKNFIKLRFGKVVGCTSLTEVSKWLSYMTTAILLPVVNHLWVGKNCWKLMFSLSIVQTLKSYSSTWSH
jgi:hypothetical protein